MAKYLIHQGTKWSHSNKTLHVGSSLSHLIRMKMQLRCSYWSQLEISPNLVAQQIGSRKGRGKLSSQSYMWLQLQLSVIQGQDYGVTFAYEKILVGFMVLFSGHLSTFRGQIKRTLLVVPAN